MYAEYQPYGPAPEQTYPSYDNTAPPSNPYYIASSSNPVISSSSPPPPYYTSSPPSSNPYYTSSSTSSSSCYSPNAPTPCYSPSSTSPPTQPTAYYVSLTSPTSSNTDYAPSAPYTTYTTSHDPYIISQDESSLRREQQFNEICSRYEINPVFAKKMRALEGYEIVVIADDSGSMNSMIDSSCPYGKASTRWEELKITLSIIVEIASTMDSDGVDVYFLNRAPILNVTHGSQLENAFKIKPGGYTPIVPILSKILSKRAETPRLIIIATDGEPTNQNGDIDIPSFRHILTNGRTTNDYVTILACTDNDDTMEYLNNWDREIPRLDVVDDYVSEKQEIQNVQGSNFIFSFGDYVVKSLMGSVDQWFDRLDEVKIYDGAMSATSGQAYLSRSKPQPNSNYNKTTRNNSCAIL